MPSGTTVEWRRERDYLRQLAVRASYELSQAEGVGNNPSIKSNSAREERKRRRSTCWCVPMETHGTDMGGVFVHVQSTSAQQ